MRRQPAFDFIVELPPRPKKAERTFVCVVPNPIAAATIETLARKIAHEAGLADRLMDSKRYHLSLVHISDRDRLRSRDVFVVAQAARLIHVCPFEVCLSRAGSVRGPPRRAGPPRHPLVMLADQGPIVDLFRSLGKELRKLGIRVGEDFTPHLTLAYSEQFVPMRPIQPIRFAVCEFVLIHSERGLTKHNVLGTWPLH